MEVTLENYQGLAHKYANYENDIYPYLGLQEEIGEAIGKIAKSYRGDKELDLEELKKELGDCLWMLSEIACICNQNLFDCIKVAIPVTAAVKELDIKEKDFTDILRSNEDPQQKLWTMIGYYGFDLKEILQLNINKLEDRFQRGVIKGNGDNR